MHFPALLLPCQWTAVSRHHSAKGYCVQPAGAHTDLNRRQDQHARVGVHGVMEIWKLKPRVLTLALRTRPCICIAALPPPHKKQMQMQLTCSSKWCTAMRPCSICVRSHSRTSGRVPLGSRWLLALSPGTNQMLLTRHSQGGETQCARAVLASTYGKQVRGGQSACVGCCHLRSSISDQDYSTTIAIILYDIAN